MAHTTDKQQRQRKFAWLLYVVLGFKGTLSHFGRDRQLSYLFRSQVQALINVLEELEINIRHELRNL